MEVGILASLAVEFKAVWHRDFSGNVNAERRMLIQLLRRIEAAPVERFMVYVWARREECDSLLCFLAFWLLQPPFLQRALADP